MTSTIGKRPLPIQFEASSVACLRGNDANALLAIAAQCIRGVSSESLPFDAKRLSAALRLMRLISRCASLRREDLERALQMHSIPADVAASLWDALQGRPLPLPRALAVKSLRWRVDVTISTSVLNRVMEPVVLVHLVLSDDSSHLFEVPLARLHHLRFVVARVLSDMKSLEDRVSLRR